MKKQPLLFLMSIVICYGLFSSCNPALYAEASLDGTKRRSSGDSYDIARVDKADFGVNFCAMLYAGSSGFKDPQKLGLHYRNSEEIFTSFYRSPINEAGNAAEYPAEREEIKDRIKLFTGIEFVMKNSKDEDVKIHANYLQVPIYAAYLHPLKDGGKVFGGLGPYLAYGIGGKTKGNGFSEKTFDKDFGLKRFDAGLTVTGGYMFSSGFYGRLAYDYGLADIDDNEVDKTKNRSFSLSIGLPISNLVKKKAK